MSDQNGQRGKKKESLKKELKHNTECHTMYLTFVLTKSAALHSSLTFFSKLDEALVYSRLFIVHYRKWFKHCLSLRFSVCVAFFHCFSYIPAVFTPTILYLTMIADPRLPWQRPRPTSSGHQGLRERGVCGGIRGRAVVCGRRRGPRGRLRSRPSHWLIHVLL